MIPHPLLLKSRRARSLGLCLLAMLIASTVLVRRAFVFSPAGQTFTVINTNDSGVGSLRQAILDANANAGLDTINFSIGSGVQTINVGSTTGVVLPTITSPVSIDGTTQPGYAGSPLIELNGTSATGGAIFNGLYITAGASTVKGLVINRFRGAGIYLEFSGGNVISANFIGTDVSGTIDLGNINLGIFVNNTPNNIIGGTTPLNRNVISGNDGPGISVGGANATGNVIEGNFIGTSVNGTAALGNAGGVAINQANNIVGGTTAGVGNVIAGNNNYGVNINGTGHLVQGNFIGTNAAGTAALGNNGPGISIFVGSNNTVGGTAAGARNLISGNGEGILIGTGASANLVQGNFIGTDVTGALSVANSSYGVDIVDSPNNVIGGTTVAARNIISGTTGVPANGSGHGIKIQGSPSTGNLVQGNYIGTDVTGTVALPNVRSGVLIFSGATSNTIGGAASGARNIISGNSVRAGNGNLDLSGVDIQASGNTVNGNSIGTDVTGANRIPNGSGIHISGSNNTIINNLISGNTQNGIDVSSGNGDLIQSNRIFSNGGKGINVNAGANNNQTTPILTALSLSGGNITIQGTLSSTANGTFNIQFFANDACDASGAGEGQNLQGATSTTTDASGRATFDVTIPGSFPASQLVTATATDANNNTSAFSACRPLGITSNFKISGHVADNSGNNLSGILMLLNGSTTTITDGNGNYAFAGLAAGGNYTVAPSSTIYSFSPTSQTFNSLNVDRVANFVGTQTVVSIAGKVVDANSAGINNVTLALTKNGAAAGTTQTNAAGDYNFGNLAAAASYVVKPTGNALAPNFAPSSQTFNNLTVNAAANFKAAPSIPPQCSTVSFASATNFAVQSPGSGALSDFNGDGKLDVAVAIANNTSSNVAVLLGNGTGAFGPPTNFAVASFPDSVAVGDFNGDGKPDLAVTNGSSIVSVILGNGAGGFGPARIFAVGPTSISVVVGDFNNDGKPDLAVASFDSNSVSVLLGNGDGTFAQATNFSVGTSPNSAAVGDFNADGKLDLAVVNQGSNNVSLLLGNGVGGFAAAINFPVGAGPGSVAVADFNADGKLDLAVANPNSSNVSVLLGNGAGSFAPATNFVAGVIPSFVAAADLNGDGKVDLVVANFLSNNVSVLLGNGDGSFTAATNFAVGTQPVWVAVGDFNSDGKSDLISANDGSNNLSVLLNNGAMCHVQNSLSITGQIRDAANKPLSNVTLTLSGPDTRVVQSDVNGNYSFPNLTPGGDYAVTVQSPYFVLVPSRADFFNLSSSQTFNFQAAQVVVPPPTPPLSDDFASPTRDATKWNLGTETLPVGSFDSQVTTTQVNGQLVIAPLTQAVGMHYDGYVSVNSFDLRGGTASVELAKAATGGADSIFAVGSDANNFMRFLVHTPGAPTSLATSKGPDGLERPFDSTTPQLLFQVNIAGHLETLPINYDPVQHRFMRFLIDAAANTVKFQTSPDDVAYTTQLEKVLGLSVSALTAELTAGTSSPTNPGLTIFDNLKVITSTFQFSATGYSVNESDGSVQITVTRSGLTTNAASVDFATMDGTAHQTNKYIATAGRLSFAAGQTSKTFSVLIENNPLPEGNETVNLLLSNPVGSGLNSPGRSVLTIVDNSTTAPTTNALDDSRFFVTQQYLDFLNRQPDASGVNFWTNNIESCGSNAACRDAQRINTSAAFFLSIEFQQTGYLVERIYKAAYGEASGTSTFNGSHQLAVPIIRFGEFLPDTQAIGQGVIVGQSGWETVLENNKQAFTSEFVQRSRFTAAYATSMTPTQFVNQLFGNAGVTPSTTDRNAAIAEFGSATNTSDGAARGRALRRVAENATLNAQEFNRAFVLLQFIGYLRRNPNDTPDSDYTGYDFWLTKLNQFGGNFVNAEMVKAFISSTEYRQRFGP